jgi:hypothetical protein
VCMSYLLYVPSTKFMFTLNKLVLFFTLQHVSAIYGHRQFHNYTFTLNFFCYFYPTLARDYIWKERNMGLFTELMPSNSIHKHNKLKTKLFIKLRIKSKAIPVTGLGGLPCCEMLRIPHCLDNRLTDGAKVVSPTHRPHFTPQKQIN